jgi:hypothetical protein
MGDAPKYAGDAGGVNVMAWVPTTRNEVVTTDAAAYTLFPGCVAVIVHVPSPTGVITKFDIEQTDALEADSVTGSPELALAEIV